MNSNRYMIQKERIVFLGADHAGFDVKEKIKKKLIKKYNVFDMSEDKIEGDDYTSHAFKVGEIVRTHHKSKGILFCGSGEGMCIAANKVEGIRAVAPETKYSLLMSRIDNDANVLCISGRKGNMEKKMKMIDLWLNTNFSNEDRHRRRIEKIKEYENKKR
jgi:ribose 5-phosphate isomerase B